MKSTGRFWVAMVVVLSVVAVGCAADDLESEDSRPARGGFFPDLPDPTDDVSALPDDYRQALPRDAIAPVYEPTFVRPERVDWPDDELVIGVDLNGEQRAYPVGYLTFREIVIDDHRGIPTMVTW